MNIYLEKYEFGAFLSTFLADQYVLKPPRQFVNFFCLEWES